MVELLELPKETLIDIIIMKREEYNELLNIRYPRALDQRLEIIESTLTNLLNLIDTRLGITLDKKKYNVLSSKIRDRIKSRDNFTCQNCGHKHSGFGEIKLHVDHIIPRSKGGSDEDSNLRTLCSSCNLLKSNHIFNELKEKQMGGSNGFRRNIN